MVSEQLTSSKTSMNGELTIDNLNGIILFKDGWGATILRITHLPTPVPGNVMIDMTAIAQVTSYTPIEQDK